MAGVDNSFQPFVLLSKTQRLIISASLCLCVRNKKDNPRITKKRMPIVKKTQRNNLFHDFSGLSQYYLLLLHRTN